MMCAGGSATITRVGVIRFKCDRRGTLVCHFNGETHLLCSRHLLRILDQIEDGQVHATQITCEACE